MISPMKLAILIGVLASVNQPSWSLDPLVMTTQGLLRGSRSKDLDYAMFLGIPYATVDTENPFGEALPAPVFDDIFEANDDSAICPQREEFNNTIVGSLDCLHLHVYVPSSASSSNRLPVMVWIHGGGFEIGWAGRYLYGPEYLVRHDVILVALNYRLGPYGFMCLDNAKVPGNTGMKDQQIALRWIKENIGNFGGDADSITIFGESAGATSVELHVLSPGSKGLFNRAILQSGSVFTDTLISGSNPTAPIDLAKQLGYDTDELDEALNFIKNSSTEDLIHAQEMLGYKCRVCIEKSFKGVNQFLGTSPLHLLESAQYESVPILTGHNSQEWLSIHLSREVSIQNYYDLYTFKDSLIHSFKFEETEQLEHAARLIQDFYIGNKEISRDVLYELVDFDSDYQFNHPTERSISFHLAKSNHSVYQYVFSYSGEVNFVKRRDNITEGEAVHADDIGLLFKQIYMPDENSPEDQLMIDRMSTMWTNFAKYGDPTPEVSELVPVRWPAATLQSRDFLQIDSELRADKKPFHQRMAFWDLFFQTYGKYYWMN